MTDVLAFPTSFAQQRLWFLNELEPHTSAYNISTAVRMSGALNIVALGQALSEIVRRHDSMRTTFANLDGRPIQIIKGVSSSRLLFIDMSGLIPSDVEEAALNAINQQAGMTFDLERGPLFRITLIRLSRQEYIVAVVMHHIISDGWSLSVLISEMERLYRHYSRGASSSLPELPIQYRDYSVWQRQWLSGDALGEQVEYWRDHLSGIQPLDLSAGRRRHQDQSGDIASLQLNRTLTASLKVMAGREGATMFMSMLAVFKVLLSRYTGQIDVAVGTPIANRGQAQLEGLIGFFLNTLVLRSRMNPDLRMRDLIQQEKAIALDAFAHQNLPFEKLVEELQPDRDLSRNPLFDVMFNFVNTPVQTLEMSGISLSSIHPQEAESKLPLTVYAQETGETLALTARYQRSFFSREFITTLLDQFRFLLEQASADVSKPAGAYSLVTPEMAALLPDPSEQLDEPRYEPITVTFSRVAAQTPSQVAISRGAERWNYGQLAESARELALHLIAGGVERGDVIAVFGSRSFGAISSIMAALLSGGVLLTLDPALPSRRLRQMISLAGAKRVLYVGALRQDDDWLNEESGPAVTVVDPETAAPIGQAHEFEATTLPTISPGDPCYIFFTSGTSGQPRAVLGTHRGLSHFLAWQRTRFAIGKEDRAAQLTGFSFDVVLRDIFLPLTSGATLCLPDEEDESRPDRIVLWLDRERITTLHTVPALAETWLAEAPPEASLEHLRRVFFAGEPLRDSLVRRWRESFPEAGDIVNLYGPTETTLAKCFYVVPDDVSEGIQPVGRPLPETQALVLNSRRALCGAGELGEIVIRTPFRTLGYLNDSDANEKRFVINPFRDDPRDLIYFTGDGGRYRADGSLEIVGRLDNQIKIRGVRVEPEEVAAVLSESPLVASCVVLAQTDGANQVSLTAYVVPSTGERGVGAELRAFAAARLPAVMAPSSFVVVDRIPVTPNGKVDKAALASSGRPIDIEQLEHVSPRTPVEEVLASIWEDLLGAGRISIHDNFFELGGHSLLATRVASRLDRALGISVPLRTLFEHPTIAGLAAEVESLTRSERELRIPPIERGKRGSVFPLSFAQQRLWILHRLDPESHAYNVPLSVRLAGALDVLALDRGLSEIVKRHEVLRTAFPLVDGHPVQRPLDPGEFGLRIIDLLAIPERRRDGELDRIMTADACRPFLLTRESSFRATLVRLSTNQHLLLMAMHHIIVDGWSRAVLAKEILRSYRGMRTGAPPLPEPALQYGDFAVWQRRLLEGELIESLLSFWRRQLEGAPSEIALRFDRKRPAQPRNSGAIGSVLINRELSDRAVRLGRQNGSSLFMTMLSVLEILLFKWTGQSDIVVGTVIANRNRLETESVLGCFINFLPVRVRISPGDSGLDVLEQTRRTVLDAYHHQDCPFDLIVEAVKPHRAQNANPIYNVVFQLQNLPRVDAAEIEDLEARYETVELGTSLLDLRFVAHETADGITLLCEYSTELFEHGAIDSLLSCYPDILLEMIEEPGASLSQYHLSEGLVEQARRSEDTIRPATIAIASTFTAEPVEDALKFWTKKLALDCEIEFAPFNQLFQQLLDPSSLFSRNRNGLNVILLRFEDWKPSESESSNGSKNLIDMTALVERDTMEMVSALKALARRSSTPCVVCFCPASPSLLVKESDIDWITKWEESLKAEIESTSGLHVITGRELNSKYPVADYYDHRGDELGLVPYTPQFFTALGTMIARKLNAIQGSPYKVIALDCDNTLWNGVCGEDGPEAVRIDPPCRSLHEFMIAQHDAGMILCLCSKNNEADVLEVFERNSEMRLKQDHIVARRINWSPKAHNLRALADELRLGLDSFIFIDDDPAECAAVRATCPEVLTLQLPERRELISRFLENVWAFDHVKATDEDRRRTTLYRQEREREGSRREAPTFAEFLAGLELCVDISRLETDDLDRVSQLTYRTNQFNVTGRGRTAQEIKLLHESGSLECHVVRMSDRFGDYGLVGALIFEPEAESLKIDTFLLSCRALGKNAERRMLAWLGRCAIERGLSEVIVPYVRSARNQPALEFLESMAGALKQPLGEGFLFRFPAAYAAVLHETPATPPHAGAMFPGG